MKRRIYTFLILLLAIFSLVGCSGEVEEINPIKPNHSDLPSNPSITTPSVDASTPEEEDVVYTVKLIYNKRVFDDVEDIQAVWSNGNSIFTSDFNDEYVASTKNLDGDYYVYLSETPDGYTYNPNIYKTNEDNRDIEIELMKVTSLLRNAGNGTSLYKAYKLKDVGTYRATIEKANQIVYFEYTPPKSGVYIVESLVNVVQDEVNPTLNVHEGSTEYKNETPAEIIDRGGSSNSFSKNFKWQLQLYDAMLGSVYTFGIKADHRFDEYDEPIYVDFTITYMTEYEYLDIISQQMIAQDERVYGGKTDEYDPVHYNFINMDGGTGNYQSRGSTNGTGIINGTFDNVEDFVGDVIFNPEDNFYHYETLDGPIICAYISSACPYYDQGFNTIEYVGNKALTVSDGTENYKQFIEVTYTNYCNSQGVCYVTPELKDFLQKFSVSQRLFSDGNGYVEGYGTLAREDDQWLFACGYYKQR